MRPLLCSLFALLAVCGCAGRDDAAVPPGRLISPRIADIATGYKSLQLITREPVQVNPEFAVLCVGPWQSQVDAARRQHGPHANAAIRIYMNDLAANAFDASPHEYPVGSIIVKEKQPRGHSSPETESGYIVPPDGVGGMVKRDPGFDPDGGDWEYFYFEQPSEVERGRIASCVQCHRGAAATDYVFGGWANPRGPSADSEPRSGILPPR